MDIKKDSVDGLKHSYQVSVTPELIEMRVKTKILDAGKNAKIPGFRPGKAPLQVLQKRYESTARPEVIRAVIDETYRKLLADKKLRAANQPQITVDSYEVNQALVCTYEFEVLPDIKDIDLKKTVKVTKLSAKVDQTLIDEAVGRIADTNKTTKPIEKDRAAKKGDVVFIDFSGRTKDGPITGGSGKGVQLEIGSGYFIPGFEDQIIDMKKGQNKKIEVKFPDEYSAKDLAGKDATFECTLQDIHEAEKPKIDDAFCKNIGFESRKALDEAVEKQLQAENDRIAFTIVKKDILDALDKEKFDLPESLVESELQQIMPDVPETDGDKKEAKKDKDEKEKMRKIAERRVRLGLILADIGNKNKVEVTNKELHQAMIEQARRYPGEEQKVMDFFMKNTSAQQSIRAPIYEDKVIQVILDKSSVTEKTVSQKELEKAMQVISEADI